ncbi:MAG: nuclear transport factor 2 family protein [Spirochaetes bacterium]|nr:nuclear transport factor 2 family protein [Spirochaetota bacterium]
MIIEYPTKHFEKYMDSINTRDFSQVAKLLCKNATFCYSGQKKTDLEKVKAFHENFWDVVKDSKWWATDIAIVLDSEKCQVYTYQYNYSGKVDGELVEGNGRSTDVFVKNNGQWELLHEHSSSEAPNHDD